MKAGPPQKRVKEEAGQGEATMAEAQWASTADVAGQQPVTRKVWVTGGERQPPQLEKPGATTSDVRAFLRAYEKYRRGVEFPNGDSEEHGLANLRELVVA